MLSCISLGMANTRPELQSVATKTLMAVQKDRLQVDIKKVTDKVITDLFKLGALIDACDKDCGSLQNVSLDFNVSVCSYMFVFFSLCQLLLFRVTNHLKFLVKPDKANRKRKRLLLQIVLN